MQFILYKQVRYISIIFVLLLFGCGESTRKTMGITRPPPDEFAVYKHNTLSVPPNFELKAPGIDNDRNINEKDENLLFNEENNSELTINDELLLMAVGEDKIDRNIRETIDKENSLKEVDKSTLDKILDFEPIFEEEEKEKVINAEEEKKRLEQLKAEIKDIEDNVREEEEKNKEEDKFEQTTLHSIATENDEDRRPKADINTTKEEKSILDKIFDFELFSSEDEQLDGTNQRDRTFFNKKKDKIVSDNNQIDSNEKRDKVDSINDENKIIDAVISEKEGSID